MEHFVRATVVSFHPLVVVLDPVRAWAEEGREAIQGLGGVGAAPQQGNLQVSVRELSHTSG
jgi:hypothetical protein